MNRLIQYTGLVVFVLAMIAYTALPFISTLRVDEAMLDKAQAKVTEQQWPALQPELEALKGKDLGKFAFVSAVDDAITRANTQLENDHKIWDYNRQEYKLYFTKYAMNSWEQSHNIFLFLLIYGGFVVGGLLYIIPQFYQGQPGIKNDGIYHNSMTSRGVLGIVTGVYMILFYIVLYFYPAYVAENIAITDPLSRLLNGGEASQWFMYGFIYTIAILVMGVRMFAKYRHSQYHLIRTASVMFFQLGFAFLLPEILRALNQPSYDLKNIWPLDYTFFYDYRLEEYLSSGFIGMLFLIIGLALIFIAVPVLTYLYGKRWYCSWVCGCGGLAETLGDPYRQLSDKSLNAWKVERILIHSVLVLAVIMTAVVLYQFFTGSSQLIGNINAYDVRSAYGFMIGSIFAGVVGTGFYPLMGNRVWCRFGCPLAAMFGIIQRFKSRFRITTNSDQCISCGNCSTYCEQGIDVRWYAQRGQNIVRSSCVGCGVCAAVCPRGVLRLENGPDDQEERTGVQAIYISRDEVKVLS